MGQRFLYQSDLIFQSIKSVISTRANTTIALQSACNRADKTKGAHHRENDARHFLQVQDASDVICLFLLFSRYFMLKTLGN